MSNNNNDDNNDMEIEKEQARQNWDSENNIVDVNEVYEYDEFEYEKLLIEAPWNNNPQYFTKIKMSAIALMKIAIHAESGNGVEIMGLMQGYIRDDTFIIVDAFAVPAEGIEYQVNLMEQSYEYMVNYLSLIRQVGRIENAIGWYHSHPGFGCWLSGIDVNTQLNWQQQGPFCAVVVDPYLTVSSQKVEIKGFRCWPKNYKPPNQSISEYQTIPLDKIEDFGVHGNEYYELDLSFYKTQADNHLLELLWNKYWISTLASSPVYTNREFQAKQLNQISLKLEQAEAKLSNNSFRNFRSKDTDKDQLNEVTKDCAKVTADQIHGLMSQVMKNFLFNGDLLDSMELE